MRIVLLVYGNILMIFLMRKKIEYKILEIFEDNIVVRNVCNLNGNV